MMSVDTDPRSVLYLMDFQHAVLTIHVWQRGTDRQLIL